MPRHMTVDTLHDARVLLDCRWLGIGGAGRATELLLRGLARSEPPGRWVLWGPPSVQRFLWRGAQWWPSGTPPGQLWGQRDAFRVPVCDVSMYMHQIRPLRPGRSVTLIHDTIPLRYGKSAGRVPKGAYLGLVARLSTRIVTVSQHSKRCIERDLRVPPSRIRVVRYPVDAEMVARVRALRQRCPQRDVAVYVGRFAPHKNLHALILAFARTRFRQRGGSLLLVGGSPAEVSRLRRFVEGLDLGHVEVQGPCTQEALEEIYATSRLLVMPSLEEGFGLPVWEAMTSGLPVCVSDGVPLAELPQASAYSFPARSLSAMAAAIDRAADRPTLTEPSVRGPTVVEFAEAFVDEVSGVLALP